VIAHRPNTVSTCDVIFELDGGRIVGRGTPGEMLQHSAAFRRMAAAR
jgi:ABC-type multidrug transport system fused ATPase/permease subunit